MSTLLDQPAHLAEQNTQPIRQRPRPRIRGARLPALPSWPLVAQVGGGAAGLCGVYLQWGAAITLITGGVVAVLIGMLREAGKI
jgi:hypothetical protein